MMLENILQGSHYSLDLFAKESIERLKSRVKTKGNGGGRLSNSYQVTCLIREKEIKLTPEEIVRQLYLDKLINEYGYKKENIDVEIGLQRGRDKYKPKQDDKKENKDGKERVDILIYQNQSPYIVVEVKKPKEQDGKKQLESYLRYLNAPLGVLCNGDSVEEFYNNKEDTQYKTTKLEKLSDIPKAHQTLQEILEKKYTLKDLYINDELQTKNLKKIITDFEDVILANSGVDSFEEIFKLIFTKLYDETESVEDNDEIFHKCKDKNFNNYPQMIEYLKDMDDKNFRVLQFRNYGNDENFKKRLDTLFSEAKRKWRGIFDEDTNFELTVEELRISVSYLQDVKLFNSNLDVIDDAFEYLVTKKQKGDKGQYFTPRYVIDMCVKMLNPEPQETMIDTASGSCGFPMHCILYVWNKLHSHSGYLITNQKRTKAQKDYVENVFAIDFDEKSVRIGRLLNKIAGDGETNVLRLNSLHFKQWKNEASVGKWDSIYQKGFENLERLCRDSKKYNEKYAKDYKFFNFDIVMANPPFAGDITNKALYESYELGKNKISRDILFIERNLNMLRPGGRMAIVLPQGRFNNSSNKYIREFIADRARILAVIGLHQNVFKPHTGTKTSVLFLQKWGGVDEKGRELCPRLEDYNIFFATQNLPGKDNSGEKIYLRDKDSNYILDSRGHKIINHDLYSHEGLTQDGIAEAFIEFARAENLSFWRENE